MQVASNPDGPFAEKLTNPTGLDWSTPNSGVLVINEFGYRNEAARGPACDMAARCTDHQRQPILAGGGQGITQRMFLADQQLVQLVPLEGQAARGWYAGVSAMYAPPELNRFNEYCELRLYRPSAVSAERHGVAGRLPKCL